MENSFSKVARRFDRFIIQANKVLLVTVGIAFTLLVGGEVFSRYVLDFSIYQINALARLLLVWFFMLGMGLALRDKLHVGYDSLKDRMPYVGRRVAEIIAHISIIVFCLLLMWSSFLSIPNALRNNLSSLNISLIWGIVAFPVGSALMLYHAVVQMFEGSRSRIEE